MTSNIRSNISLGPKRFDMVPETGKEQLERWDGDQVCWSIEMGGIGPSYEQAIQIGVMELLRKILPLSLPKEKEIYYKILDDLMTEVDKEQGLQLSGAQANAIIYLAYSFAAIGPRASLEKACEKEDLSIMVTKYFPSTRSQEEVLLRKLPNK